MPRKKTPAYTAYEIFIRDLMENLIRLEGNGFRNVSVKHNARIRGISGVRRQIDVYWEFEFAGGVYRNVIQAKKWNSKITLGTIDTLHSVIRDIPGGAKGYLITTVGFQSGAIEYAKTHGIELYKLHELTADQRRQLNIADPPTIDAFWCSINHICFTTATPISEEFRLFASEAIEKDQLVVETLDGSDSESFAAIIERSKGMPKEGLWSSVMKCQSPLRIVLPSGLEAIISEITITWLYERMAPTMQIGHVITHLFGTATGETAFLVDANMRLKRVGEPFEDSSPAIDTEPFRSRPSQTRLSFVTAGKT